MKAALLETFVIRDFTEVTPKEASQSEGNITLPRDDIMAPFVEGYAFDNLLVCPWPWDPIQLVGAPIGQYHCPYCGVMVMGGMHHLDYRDIEPRQAIARLFR